MKRWAIWSILALLGAEQFVTFPPHTGRYDVIVLDVYDGDTATVGLIVPVKVRLYGIDAPELKGDEREDGIKSRDALRQHLRTHRIVSVELRGVDKYGRTLGIFRVLETAPLSVNDWMVKESLAREYRP